MASTASGGLESIGLQSSDDESHDVSRKGSHSKPARGTKHSPAGTKIKDKLKQNKERNCRLCKQKSDGPCCLHGVLHLLVWGRSGMKPRLENAGAAEDLYNPLGMKVLRFQYTRSPMSY